MSLDFSMLLREDAHLGRDAHGRGPRSRWAASWLRLLAAAMAVTLVSLSTVMAITAQSVARTTGVEAARTGGGGGVPAPTCAAEGCTDAVPREAPRDLLRRGPAH